MMSWFAALRRLGARDAPDGSVRPPRRKQRQLAERPTALALDIAPDDPLVAYCLRAPGVVEVDRLQLDSPTLREWQAAKMRLALPLVSQGELIGVITLGPRVGGEDYSADDLATLNTLATQVAPAVRVAQLAREQQAQARERERIEHELSVARLIQQTLLPKEAPELPGWRLAAYYQPARAVGGDFYDFLALPDGRLGLVIGDVTDKGTPAALLMATTRSILRAAALDGASPGAALERTNGLLRHDIPPRMFVTCLYAVLEPQSGRLRFANAGHNLPLWRHEGDVTPLRASGMPLGLMPDMRYEEQEITLATDESVLLYSDGLVEARNVNRAMFGRLRLETVMTQPYADRALIDHALSELHAFVGDDWEQEDDVTLVTLRAVQPPGSAHESDSAGDLRRVFGAPDAPYPYEAGAETGAGGSDENAATNAGSDDGEDNDTTRWRTLGEWALPSHSGDERLAMTWVAETFAPLALPTATLERLKTAVAEATMNAMEHGNQHDPTRRVYLEALVSPTAVAVRVGDEGAGAADYTPKTPDLAAKLAGEESPRGWGLFLIGQLVDEAVIEIAHGRHTVRLVVSRGAPEGPAQPEGERDVRQPN